MTKRSIPPAPLQLTRTERILVVGSSCAGKTTFAAALAARLRVPHIQLDALHHLPGWVPRPKAELRALVAEAIKAPAWVLDGNYLSLQDVTWPRATHILWLDYPFPIVYSRAIRRTVRRVFRRETLYNGNQETFRQAFLSRDSMLLWVIQRFWDRRTFYAAVFAAGPDDDPWQLEKVSFKHPRAAAHFLENQQMPPRPAF